MKMIKNFKLWLFGLIFLFSCGNPNDPESLIPPDISGGYKIVNKFVTSGYAQDVLKKDNLLYIAQGEGGLLILDVADPLNPQTVSLTTEDLLGYSYKIAIKDSIVYLAAGINSVFVVDVSDPSEPLPAEVSCPYKPARNLHILGDLMFIAISENGVGVSSLIDDPLYPEAECEINTSGYAYGLTTTADSNYLLVACGEMGLSIFDISNLQQGIFPQVGWCDTPGYAEAVTILENGSIAFLACGTAGLQIIDYSDTSNVYIAGSFDGDGYAKSLKYKNNKIYMTAEMGGLQIINVADVTHPNLIGEVETEFAVGLEVDDEYIYVADEVEGVIIISIPE